MLAFGTVPVAAGVITVLKLAAVRTAIDLSTQAFGTTMFNRPHCLTMRGEQFVGIFFAVVRAIRSQEISQF